MTRFAIHHDFLYVLNNVSIQVFAIHDSRFTKVNQVEVDWGLETIFATDDFLYLGSNNSMHIFSLAEPQSPSFVFRYAHIRACDPVVVQGNRAYVTLRDGPCGIRGENLLEIIDITDPYAPSLVASYPVASPHGLAVDNHLLFLCEGKHGLKVFDITNEHDIQLLTHLTTFHAYDVILRNEILTITGEDGIFQYRYDRMSGAVEHVSTIPVNRAEI